MLTEDVGIDFTKLKLADDEENEYASDEDLYKVVLDWGDIGVAGIVILGPPFNIPNGSNTSTVLGVGAGCDGVNAVS